MTRQVLITLTGPSCAGKTTLEERLIARGAARVISNTTRAPRAGEVDGVHYKFRDHHWFDRQRAIGGLVEYVEFNGNYYGNTREDIMDALKRGDGFAVWVIEPHGHKQVKEWAKNSPDGRQIHHYSVFIDGSPKIVAERFLRRVMEDTKGSLKTYAARLEAMMTTELAWRLEAGFDVGMNGQRLYDLFVERYDETNETDVESWLVALAKNQAVVGSLDNGMHFKGVEVLEEAA